MNTLDLVGRSIHSDGMAGTDHPGTRAPGSREQVVAVRAGIGREIRFHAFGQDQAVTAPSRYGRSEPLDDMIPGYPEDHASCVPPVHSVRRVTGKQGRIPAGWTADDATEFPQEGR